MFKTFIVIPSITYIYSIIAISRRNINLNHILNIIALEIISSRQKRRDLVLVKHPPTGKLWPSTYACTRKQAGISLSLKSVWAVIPLLQFEKYFAKRIVCRSASKCREPRGATSNNCRAGWQWFTDIKILKYQKSVFIYCLTSGRGNNMGWSWAKHATRMHMIYCWLGLVMVLILRPFLWLNNRDFFQLAKVHMYLSMCVLLLFTTNDIAIHFIDMENLFFHYCGIPKDLSTSRYQLTSL